VLDADWGVKRRPIHIAGIAEARARLGELLPWNWTLDRANRKAARLSNAMSAIEVSYLPR
jgi:hypothetical protein